VPDDLWSRGKCGLKVLQYMAAGLPVVANPVGVQADLVRQGETGFLAETPDQWAEAVGRLGSDPALRRRMGRAGRQRVEAEFSVAAGAACWVELLERLEPRRQAA
jgi:glycosyltransferase involved in cell wall biosynthesis